MALMTARQFIEVVFIHQVGEIVSPHPYIAFMTMGIGIEFLGKCLNAGDFHEDRVSRQRFEEAINHIPAFSKYRMLVGKGSTFDLYDSLRCGLAHTSAPKYPITFSSKDEMANLIIHGDGKRANLRCEDFYADFRIACEELFNMPDPVASKLSLDYLAIPDYENGRLKVQTVIKESPAS